jgi:hypothetical protein
VKFGVVGIKIILFLLIMTTIFAQQAVAKPQYLAALRFVYGDGSCATCHIDQNDGKSLTDYGSRFNDQHIHIKDSVIALRAVGDPKVIPAATSVVEIVTPVPTDISLVTAIPIATTTPVTTTSVITTIVSAIRNEGPLGFGIGITIGIILIIYMLRRRNTEE